MVERTQPFLGQFLNFMSEEAGELGVFFIFTANDMSKFLWNLYVHFDGRYFVDLPSAKGREAIFNIHLSKRKHTEKTMTWLNLYV